MTAVLTALVAVPAALALWLLLAGRDLPVSIVRPVALATAGVTGLLALVAAVGHGTATGQGVAAPSVPLAVDGISAPLVVLTALVGVLVTAHSWVELPEGGSPGTFLGCLLLVEAGALATFAARDAVLFFVAFEVVLVPMWVLITRFGDRRDERARADAGWRFILYTAAGSTLMLLGILWLVTAAGTRDLGRLASAGALLPPATQLGIALLLVGGLAVKVPVLPLHTWLPPAHTTAPTAGSVLLAAVLLKMGTYGLVRLPVATLPDAMRTLAPVLGVLGALGVVWGGLVCLVERDLKRLVAYSSVAHMGFVVLGIASGTETGLQAALLGNIAHGLVSALLFVLVGGLKHRWGSVDLRLARPALRETSPRLGFFAALGFAAALGLPGLAAFWGELLALLAAWSPADPAATGWLRTAVVLAALGAALAAAYSLRVLRAVWVGDAVPPQAGASTPDARGVELGVLVTLAVGIVALGVWPDLVLRATAGAVAALVGGAP